MAALQVARVMAAASGGRITARLRGKMTADLILVDRQVASAAQVGDQVLVAVEDGQAWAVALLGTGPVPDSTPDSTPEPASGGGGTTAGKQTFAPEFSGTFRGGGWVTTSSDMAQGDIGAGLCQGAALFGRALSSLGNITGGYLRAARLSGGPAGAQTPTMRLLAESTWSTAYPTVLGTAPGPSLTVGQSDVWVIPQAWLNQLETGAAGGLGIGISAAAPYIRLDGAGLRVTVAWTSTT